MGVVDVSGQAFPRSAGPPNPAIGHIRVAPELRVGHGNVDTATAQASVQADAQPNAQAGDPSVAAPAATSSPAPNFAPASAQHAESPAGAPTGAAPSQGVHFSVGGNDVVQAGYGPQSGTNTAAAPAGVSNAGPAIAGGSTHVAPAGGRPPAILGLGSSSYEAVSLPEHPIGIFAV